MARLPARLHGRAADPRRPRRTRRRIPAHPDAPPAHRIDRLRAWLPYLVDLGANGLLLGPVFDSETHGYDTRDHLTLDPRLGDDADLDALLADAPRAA